MKPSSGNYNRLARVYRALEYAAFGRDLERARFTLMPALAACQTILIVGEGDGRFLQRLLQLNPRARVDCVDLSPAMLARARERLGGNAAGRVRFRVGDIRAIELAPNHYDAAVTCFVLDCFSAADCAIIVARLRAALQAGALWLWSDFALPAAGPRRWRAQVWLALLYAFFRWETGLTVRALPPAEALISSAGFMPQTALTLQRGLLRSVLFNQPGSGTRSS